MMGLISRWMLVGLILSCSARGFAASGDEAVRSRKGIEALQQWYTPATGVYTSAGWWNSANAITTLANYSRVAQTKEFYPIFANTLEKAQKGPDGAHEFLNKYYDDEGWWALAWIDVYDLTGEEKYLSQADSIFKDMQLGWEDETCGGGVWWSKDNKDKNAVENELFLSVAASLANRETDAALKADALLWMKKEWVWFRDSGMINGAHLINDGLTPAKAAHCANNGKRTWTYNQGVILGALTEMSRIDSDKSVPKLAKQIAEAAMKQLKDSRGAMGELENAHDGGDVPQFKGIFVRNLMQLNEKFPVRGYEKFIELNARMIWDNDRNDANQFGVLWGGPFDKGDASRQSSALDVLVAADALGLSK